LSNQTDLGNIQREGRAFRALHLVRWLLLLGWGLASVGYYGPWIAHRTAGLALSGVDMGEFVKFLPEAISGSLNVVRQVFYLPPFTIVVTIALLKGSRRLNFAWPVRVACLLLAIPVSLQLLPPAWSLGSLMSAEFRLQFLALALCWIMLALFWPLGRLPAWIAGTVAGGLALTSAVLVLWQFLGVKASIDAVYGTPPAFGWGSVICLLGLALLGAGGAICAMRTRRLDGESR
jgi:hypothetical protein